MKKIYITLIILLLSACSVGKPIYLKGTSDTSSSTSILTSKCNKACKKLVDGNFDDHRGYLNFAIMTPQITSIDGMRGSNNWRCLDCRNQAVTGVFNSSWSNGYLIYLPAGEHEIEAEINSNLSPNRQPVSFNLKTEENHEYFIGQITSDMDDSNWSPVIIDLTRMNIIFPKSKPW